MIVNHEEHEGYEDRTNESLLRLRVLRVLRGKLPLCTRQAGWRRWLIGGFAPVVLLVLWLDSRALFEAGFNGQLLCNLAAPLYLLLLLTGLRREQQLMALVFVPFSALGEYIFSLVFQLYSYKLGSVPLYVPFGHAILFGTGLLIAEDAAVLAREVLVRRVLLLVHVALFAGALLWLGDTLSALFALPLVLILLRKNFRPFYLIMGVLVLYIELVGTAFGCWVWQAAPFGGLHTTNPPVGAFVCYLIADMCVMKIVRKFT